MSMRISYFLLICAVAMVVGCSLEEPRAVGERCEASYFQLNSGEGIHPGDSVEYDYYFAGHACPPDIPFCRTMNGEEFCSARKEACPDNTHLFEGDCEPNSVENCGAHGIDCLASPGWYSAECNAQAVCVATDCHDGYTLVDGSCQSADQCCGNYCKNCTLTTSSPLCSVDTCVSVCPGEGEINCGGSCIDPKTSRTYCGSDQSCQLNICNVEKGETCINKRCDCPVGFERCGDDVCTDLRTTEHCGSCDNDCTAMDGWRDGRCESGVCKLEACRVGYHLVVSDTGEKQCEADTIERCGYGKENCRGLFEHYNELACDKGICKVNSCETGYFLYDGICIESSGEQCGSVDNICGPHQHCNRSTSTCVCDDGYTDCDGVCYDLKTSASHCNSCNVSCNVELAQNTCDGGVCAFNCMQGYVKTQDGTGCEPQICENGQTKCNGLDFLICENNAWKTSETCTTTVNNAVAACDNVSGCGFACKPDYTNCDGVCYDLTSNKEHCGSCTNACNVADASNSCTSGSCTFSCDSGFHEFGQTCEINSVTDCGVHGKSCAVTNAENSCDNGECKFACHSGFHENETHTACSGDNLDNCGGSVCGRNQIPNGSGFVCDNGVCKVTDCESNYHLSGNTCEADSVANCGSSGNQCPKPDNGTAVCTNGSCGIDCNTGYTSHGGRCIPNNLYCTQIDATRCWNDGKTGKMQKCVDNIWTIQSTCSGNASCNSGGTGCGSCINDQKQCSERIPQTCTNGAWTGSSACDANLVCNGGSCGSCGTNQHVYGNQCEDNSVTNCGTHDHKCTKPNNGEATCTGGRCGIQCDSGHTSNGTSCVPNSVYCATEGAKRCSGRTPQVCTNNTWTGDSECAGDKICSGGVCNACERGTHVYLNTCEANDDVNCGGHGDGCINGPCDYRTCNINSGQCEFGGCVSSCHLSSGVCVPDECNDGDQTCDGNEVSLICNGGEWEVDEYCSAPVSNAWYECEEGFGCNWDCEDNYSYCNGRCMGYDEFDRDDYNCGSCGHVCDSTTVPGAEVAVCDGGVCFAMTCQQGYHDYHSTCERNDNNHCGSHDNACPDPGPCGAFVCDVNAGTCDIPVCSSGCHPNGHGDCDLDECTDGAHQCDGDGIYQVCDNGAWEVDETCSYPTNGAPLCNDSTGCSWMCVDGYCPGTGFNCVSKQTDLNNCGNCGTKCTKDRVPHSTAVRCSGGRCLATACISGYSVSGGACVPNGNSCETTGYYDISNPLEDGTYVNVVAYCIKNEDDLRAVADAVNDGKVFPDDNGDNAYILMDNVVITGSSWKPIGTQSNPFKGVFFGDGYDLYTDAPLEADSDYYGIFGYAEDSVFYNVYLRVDINGNGHSGVSAFVSHAKNSHFQEIQVESSKLNSVSSQVGTIVAFDSGSTIYYSYARNLVIESDYEDVGGLVGGAENTQIISCYVQDAQITADGNAGGMVGYSGSGFIIDDGYVEDSMMICTGYCGGIGGEMMQNASFSKVYVNNVTIESAGGCTGGISGECMECQYDTCYASVTINAADASGVGGITGCSTNSNHESCGVFGEVNGKTRIGGVVGEATSDSYTNCYSNAIVSPFGDSFAGSFAGRTDGVSFTRCYASGEVLCGNTNDCGAFVGISGSSTIENSYYNSDIDVYMSNPTGVAVGFDSGDYMDDLKSFYIKDNASRVDDSMTLSDGLGDRYSEKTCTIAGGEIKLPVIDDAYPPSVCR